MKYALERLTTPTLEPVTLAEAKRSIREFASVTENDGDITNLIVSAREWVEDYTARALVDQTWALTITGRPAASVEFANGYYSGDWDWYSGGEILLRKSPVLSVVSVTAVDSAGVSTVIGSTTYEVRERQSKFPRLCLISGGVWTFNDLRIVFRAGFADRTGSPTTGAEVVPERFKQAMKLWIEAHYDKDEKMMGVLLDAAKNLMKSERTEMSFA